MQHPKLENSVEERISELEDRTIDNTQPKQRGKRAGKIKKQTKQKHIASGTCV